MRCESRESARDAVSNETVFHRLAPVLILLTAFFVFRPSCARSAPELGTERMAALHETIVSMREGVGIPAVFTYDHDPAFWLDHTMLGRLTVGVVGKSGDVSWLHAADEVVVRNIPTGEGLEAVATVAGHAIRLEALPASLDTPNDQWEGAATFRVTCDPPAQIALRFGDIGRTRFHGFRPEIPLRIDYLTHPGFRILPDGATNINWVNEVSLLSAKEIALIAAVRVEDDPAFERTFEPGAVRSESKAPIAEASLVVSFAKTSERARELVSLPAAELRSQTIARFRSLLASAKIDTPSDALNKTFQASLLTLECSWVRPYGWIETMHHYGTLYSQQQNYAADWLGQADRSKDTLLTHAARLFPDGEVPALDPYGRARHEFGGWNQFYVWGVRHYWRQTGDLEFLRSIEEPLDRVMRNTFAKYDADDNLLLRWGQQIHNQEDYVDTPGDGVSPTLAAIEMVRVEAEVASALGKNDKARALELKARRMAERLRAELWNPDLGRYPYYRDKLGVVHLDGQYHTLIWPVLFDLHTPEDSYTSLRHLEDTLTGKDGEIAASNNFPSHVVSTVGCQAGGQQQPWGTLGWAKLGHGERAIRSLEWIAGIVANAPNYGSWPEISVEVLPAWFTPPAGVFVMGVVEGVFGLRVDKPAGTLTIAPCVPESWEKASLQLPEYAISINSGKGRRGVEIETKASLDYRFRIPIPPASGIKVALNNTPVDFTVEEGVDRLFVVFEGKSLKNAIVDLRWTPVEFQAIAPAEVFAGENFPIDVPAGEFTGIDDPCGVLKSWKMVGREFDCVVREGVAGDAANYGTRGQATLTRRTVFLRADVDGHSFVHPVDFTVRPAARFSEPPRIEKRDDTKADGWRLRFEIVPHTPANEAATIVRIGGTEHLVEVASRASAPTDEGEKAGAPQSIALTREDVRRLLPGLNRIEIVLENGRAVSDWVDASPLFAETASAGATARATVEPIPLPESLLQPDTEWRNWKLWRAYAHVPWMGLHPPMEFAPASGEYLEPPATPGLRFLNPGRHVAVVSRKIDRPDITIPVDREASKVSFLLLPLVDNHDVFSPVAQLIVHCADGATVERTLYFPGDLDWWGPRKILGDFATVGAGWSRNPTWETDTSVMNVVDVDLNGTRRVRSVGMRVLGENSAMGIVGVAVAAPAPIEDQKGKQP